MWNQLGKLKISWTRPVKEHQKVVSELWEGRNKTMRWQAWESRDSDWFLVNTQVQSHALLRQGFGTILPFINKVVVQSIQTHGHQTVPDCCKVECFTVYECLHHDSWVCLFYCKWSPQNHPWHCGPPGLSSPLLQAIKTSGRKWWSGTITCT